ncbi:MAG: mannitol dehydrogenase family protein, partial [Chloroflexota bacterium]
RRCAYTLAAWAQFMEGRDENGDPTPITDQRAPDLLAAVHAETSNPGAFLDYRSVFGDLGTNQRLREAYIAYRAAIAEQGVRATIAAIAST